MDAKSTSVRPYGKFCIMIAVFDLVVVWLGFSLLIMDPELTSPLPSVFQKKNLNCEMAQPVKECLSHKPDGLGSITWTHSERRKLTLKSCPLTTIHMPWSLHTYVCPHIHIVNKIIKLKFYKRNLLKPKFPMETGWLLLLNRKQMVSLHCTDSKNPLRISAFIEQSLKSLVEKIVSILFWTSIHYFINLFIFALVCLFG